MKYNIQQRCAGSKQAYWVLKVWPNEDTETPLVWTGKGMAGYRRVSGIRKARYPKARHVQNTGG